MLQKIVATRLFYLLLMIMWRLVGELALVNYLVFVPDRFFTLSSGREVFTELCHLHAELGYFYWINPAKW